MSVGRSDDPTYLRILDAILAEGSADRSSLAKYLHSNELAGIQMAFFPTSDGGVGGAVCQGEGYKPSAAGSLVYLNGGEDLSTPLGRVEKAGGAVVMPKTKISDEIGYIAMFTDTEGNRVAFHAPHSQSKNGGGR